MNFVHILFILKCWGWERGVIRDDLAVASRETDLGKQKGNVPTSLGDTESYLPLSV